MAWIALEMAAADALGVPGVGWRFKEDVDAALQKAGGTPIDWGMGVWQRALCLQRLRHEFVHRNALQAKLLAPVTQAEEAIETAREAIADVYARVKKAAPDWVQDDDDPGWDAGTKMLAHGTYVRAGADPKGADTIRIAYVYKDREYVKEILPAGTDAESAANELVKKMRLPISRVRAYRGTERILDQELNMRGSG